MRISEAFPTLFWVCFGPPYSWSVE